MNKLLLSLLATLAATSLAMPAAHAQRVKKDALEKARWYEAPREFQITDDRPVIKDFRTAPEDAGTVDLGNPNGASPAGKVPAYSKLPSGGLHLGDPNHQDLQSQQKAAAQKQQPAYKSAPASLTSLPKSGFGSNIPAGGLGPKGSLPGVNQGVHGPLPGVNQEVLGKVFAHNQKPAMGVPGKGVFPNSGHTSGNTTAPVARSYSGGYGQGTGTASGGSAGRTETSVRGFLLHH